MNIFLKKVNLITLILALQLICIQTDETVNIENYNDIKEVVNQKQETASKPIGDGSETETSDSETFAEQSESVGVKTKIITNEKSNVTFVDPNAANFTKVNCLMDKEYGPVEIVNYTRLMELLRDSGTSNRTRNSKEDKVLPGKCILVMFYARWCVFSSQAAPHFNAIPRFYPNLKVVAIDAMKYQNFNTQYGIVGVPTLMLVHNSKPVAKFNETVYTLETFSKFLSHLTNLQPNESLYVTSADFSGPLPSTPSNETDFCLVLSWVFIAACAIYFTMQSQWWRQFIELVQNTWRESNAQHEHVD